MASPRDFYVGRCPSNDLVYTNLLYVSPHDFRDDVRYIVVTTSKAANFVFNVSINAAVAQGELALNTQQRQWASLALSEKVQVQLYDPLHAKPAAAIVASSITFEIGTLKPGKLIAGVLDTAQLANITRNRFANQIFTRGQRIIFEYNGETFIIAPTALEAVDPALFKASQPFAPAPDLLPLSSSSGADSAVSSASTGVKVDIAILTSSAQVLFYKSPDSQFKLEGDAKRVAVNPLIQPNFRFDQLGIGGLEKEFSAIFRRAFASRTFPPDIVAKLGIQHVKGILLYGPPGTGKTLMARQISKMLNTREPMIVNGPEILNKFVGQSEENIRKLFAAAEKEYAEKGDESQLHIIIFDELDAICKQRGSKNDGTGVGDSIVNQLLSKMDGVEQLNNILVIGMTNRLDMIDEALLRPGRLELKLEISLPDESGRLQILNIHTRDMKTNNLLDDDVDLPDLAANSKNFSGAEISGLVKSAASFALNRHIKVGESIEVKDATKVKVKFDDFKRALGEVQAAFGASEAELTQCFPNGIVKFGTTDHVLETGALLIKQVAASTRTPLVSVLLHGPTGSGKTALAASMALSSGFPFVKLVSPQNMIGFAESAKASAIAKIFADAYKSSLSVVVIDDIERLLEWVPLGPRLSNVVLQTLLVLLKKAPPPGKKLLIFATCGSRGVIQQLDMTDCFNYDIYVPALTEPQAIRKVVSDLGVFNSQKLNEVFVELDKHLANNGNGNSNSRISITIKQLLMIMETSKQDEFPEKNFLDNLLGYCRSK